MCRAISGDAAAHSAPIAVGAFVVAMLAASGCTLLLPYPDLPVETGDALCADGRDNDQDGTTDCDDASCERCVALPRMECPPDWEPEPIVGALGDLHTCRPAFDPFEDCPSAAPAGALVVPSEPGALGDTLAMPPEPGLREVWLAPGVHEETAVQIGGLAVHGLCDGEARAVLRGTVPAPIAVDERGAAIDHVRIELPGGEIFVTNTSLELRNVHVTGAGALNTQDGTLDIGRSVIDTATALTTGVLQASDTTFRELQATAGTRTTLASVRVDGRLVLEGRVTSLDARDLFVGCVDTLGLPLVRIRSAAATIRGGVIVASGGALSGADAATSVVLEDVLVAASSACPVVDSPAIELVGGSLTAARVLIAAPPRVGLRLDGSEGGVTDLTVVGARTDAVELDVSDVTMDRVRVRDGARAGVIVRTYMLDADVVLRRVYVERLPSIPCTPTPCAPPSVGLAIVGRTVTLDDVAISGVDGCGIYVSSDASLRVLSGTVAESRIGLCAPGRSAPPTAGLVFEGNDQDVSTSEAVCGGGECD